MQDETHHQSKTGRFQRSRELIKSAWHVLKLDKELITLPLIGLAVSGLVALVGIILVLITASTVETSGQNNGFSWISTIILIVFGIIITFISNFIATAIARGALDRFEGHDPTIRGSLQAARQRAGSILKFSILATTVGLVLQFIQDRVPFAGKIFVWLGQLAWGVATFFVIPVIAMSEEPIGPIEATKNSGNLIKKVWGESLVVNVGIGLIAILTFIPYMLVSIFLGALAGSVWIPLGIVLGTLFALGFFGLILIFSVLSAIVRAAIYYWAITGKAPATFDRELLRASLTPKKARRFFAN